jgi:transposase
MLVQLFFPHAPQVLAWPWLHPVHPHLSKNVICDKMVCSQDQCVFIHEHYFSTQSYAECQNAFRNSFPHTVVPNKSTIQRLLECFRETGSIGQKCRSGRPSVLSNDSLEDIRARLLQSPRNSLRKTFPTKWNDLWIHTKGFKTSQTASILSSSLSWT